MYSNGEVISAEKNDLVTRMASLLKDGRGSDIQFRVGKDEVKIFNLHKAILAASSQIFDAMFYGDPSSENTVNDSASENTVEVDNWNANIFEKMLEFIYCDAQTYNMDEALDVIKVSKNYGVIPLTQKCKMYLLENLSELNVLDFVKTFEVESGYEDIMDKCMEIICFKWKMLKEDKRLLEFQSSTLDMLLERDDLKVESEVEVVEFVLRWAEEHCKQEKLPVNPENKQKVAESAVRKIRFLALSMYDFVSLTELREMMDPVTYGDILVKLVNSNSENYPADFSKKGRRKCQSSVNCSQCGRRYIPEYSLDSSFKSPRNIKNKKETPFLSTKGFSGFGTPFPVEQKHTIADSGKGLFGSSAGNSFSFNLNSGSGTPVSSKNSTAVPCGNLFRASSTTNSSIFSSSTPSVVTTYAVPKTPIFGGLSMSCENKIISLPKSGIFDNLPTSKSFGTFTFAPTVNNTSSAFVTSPISFRNNSAGCVSTTETSQSFFLPPNQEPKKEKVCKLENSDSDKDVIPLIHTKCPHCGHINFY